MADRSNFGMSWKHKKQEKILTIFYDALTLLDLIVFFIFLNFKIPIRVILILSIIADINTDVIGEILQFLSGEKLSKFIKEKLINATHEDLEKHNTCIICREQMYVGDSKVLKCSHCFHAECLEKWVYKSNKCPICFEEIEINDKNGNHE